MHAEHFTALDFSLVKSPAPSIPRSHATITLITRKTALEKNILISSQITKFTIRKWISAQCGAVKRHIPLVKLSWAHCLTDAWLFSLLLDGHFLQWNNSFNLRRLAPYMLQSQVVMNGELGSLTPSQGQQDSNSLHRKALTCHTLTPGMLAQSQSQGAPHQVSGKF